MSAPTAMMLASDAVARREDALAGRATASCCSPTRDRRHPRRPAVVAVTAAPAPRRWAGHALAAGGRALLLAGAKVAGERPSPSPSA